MLQFHGAENLTEQAMSGLYMLYVYVTVGFFRKQICILRKSYFHLQHDLTTSRIMILAWCHYPTQFIYLVSKTSTIFKNKDSRRGKTCSF